MGNHSKGIAIEIAPTKVGAWRRLGIGDTFWHEDPSMPVVGVASATMPWGNHSKGIAIEIAPTNLSAWRRRRRRLGIGIGIGIGDTFAGVKVQAASLSGEPVVGVASATMPWGDHSKGIAIEIAPTNLSAWRRLGIGDTFAGMKIQACLSGMASATMPRGITARASRFEIAPTKVGAWRRLRIRIRIGSEILSLA
ncbi:MAG: hypothetical protein IPP82_04825 [Xanthomonadales bacterium]|nr:hypothetical protein [Xanthomonadales bacterium]